MAELVKQQYHIHISSQRRWFEMNLKEVWQYRDLIVLFTKRNFKVRYKQTVLGPAWLFISPIISSMIYTFIFGGIAGIGTEGIPQILFYMSGNAIWTYFAGCITKNASTFTANAGVFGKVYFPRLTTPISNMFTSVIEFGIEMLMVLAFLVFYLIRGQVAPNWSEWLLIPVVLLHLGVMGLGVGIIISSLTTKYRDLTILVSFGVSLLMYITPVVYPISQVPEKFRWIMLLNPVAPIVETYRYSFLGSGSIEWLFLGISFAATIIILSIGIVVFNQVEKNFIDTV